MPTLTIFVGLPGSGKSHHAKTFAAEHGLALPHEDAFHRDKEVAIGHDTLVGRLSVGEHVVLDSVKMIWPNARQELETKLRDELSELVIDWRFTANEPEECRWNVIVDAVRSGRHNWRDRLDTITACHLGYEIDDGFEPLPIHLLEPDET